MHYLIMEEEEESSLEQIKDLSNRWQKCLKVNRVDLDRTYWEKGLITLEGL